MGFSIKDFHINIPEELIAQYPPRERGQSRLLLYDLNANILKDDFFENISDYIGPNDCIIFNDARVINARLHGIKRKTGAKIEILLTRPSGDKEWFCLLRPARRAPAGTMIDINRYLNLIVTDEMGDGLCKIMFSKPVGYEDLLSIGEIPLPKYIRRNPVGEIDSVRYQTIFAEKYGAVASPTAGLHFTENNVAKIKKKGAVLVPVTLYVDWGTFKPVRADDYRNHKIHREVYEISEESAQIINRCVEEGRRIVCIGTTSVRTVEAAADSRRVVRSGEGETSLYIYPGYTFKMVDGIITNFHMPDSTLILLVAAFCGKENIERAYSHAVSHKYRFFSYGDAMFIYNR